MRKTKKSKAQHLETPEAVRQDAQALVEATKGVVDDQVKAARDKLTQSIERSREICIDLEEKALEGARVADKTIQEHPYQTAFIALGVGAFLGFLLSRRP